MSNGYPFVHGEAPFCVKGAIGRGCMEYIEAHVPGGGPAVREALESDALRRCFDQPFLASGWYDAFVLDAILRAAARVSDVPLEVFLNRTFDAHAAKAQSGVYKVLLRAISPEVLIRRLPRIGTQLFNFTTSRVEELEPGHWQNIIAGVPVVLRTVYCESSAAFVSRALRTAGARDFEHCWLEPRPQPDAHGVSICTVVRDLRWSKT